MKKIKRIAALLLAGLLAVCCAGCGGNAATAETDGLKVVSTIFPGYDWLQNLMAGTGSTPTLMMKNGFIAGNINFENPDEDTACINILPETREIHFDTFLSNSFGLGGTNSTIIVKNL